jgi:hypothetical protein
MTMSGYTATRQWIDEPMTDAQKTIVTALGFPIPEKWAPAVWTCGAFGDAPIVVRHLPYLPEVNAVLKSVGFRWNADQKEWHGHDTNKEQVEVLQALHYCSHRYYREQAPKFAELIEGSSWCPVRVGAYA